MKPRKYNRFWSVGVPAFAIAFGVCVVGAVIAKANWPTPDVAPPPAATVRIELANGHGSGVHIGHGLFLTAAHVVDLPDYQVKLSDGSSHAGETLWISKDYDVALVRVADFDTLPQTARLVCAALKIGDPVRAVGHPFDLGVTTTSGKVAALSAGESPWREVLVIDMVAGAGMSGGPIFSMVGNWLRGILVGAYGQLSPLTFIVPAPTLCRLLGRVS